MTSERRPQTVDFQGPQLPPLKQIRGQQPGLPDFGTTQLMGGNGVGATGGHSGGQRGATPGPPDFGPPQFTTVKADENPLRQQLVGE